MTRPLHFDFGLPKYMGWDGTREEVFIYIHYGFEQLLCRISAEAIEDHYELTDSDTENHLDVARQHFDELTDLLWQKIQKGRFEEDGSVLLRTDDWKISS